MARKANNIKSSRTWGTINSKQVIFRARIHRVLGFPRLIWFAFFSPSLINRRLAPWKGSHFCSQLHLSRGSQAHSPAIEGLSQNGFHGTNTALTAGFKTLGRTDAGALVLKGQHGVTSPDCQKSPHDMSALPFLGSAYENRESRLWLLFSSFF